METWVIDKIARINQEFYQNYSHSFSVTRARVQPGVTRLLDQIPDGINWLDLGCGNGTLAMAWVEQDRTGYYLGCDFSPDLLRDARDVIQNMTIPAGLTLDFLHVDINEVKWVQKLPNVQWDGISLFAVLHHIPGSANRQALCSRIRQLIRAGKPVYVSVWQLQNSARLLPRIKPWQIVGIPHREVEEGDVLMDWRAGDYEVDKTKALRYVHIFSENELTTLAECSGFRVAGSFFSDGREGNLALYQKWI
jgi:SAM-dependent methyltransferase